MPNTSWEQETVALLHDAEVQKRNADLALEKVLKEIQSIEQIIAGCRVTLEQYRKKYGYTNGPIPSPIVDEEYGHLGPSAAVAQWAARHDGEVVIKELAGELLRTHTYKDYRVAYNSVYTVLKRDANFTKVKPGRYKRMPTIAQMEHVVGVVAGQGIPPHIFTGHASVDGQTAANGLKVEARINGVPRGTATVMDGMYSLAVEGGSSDLVRFFVDECPTPGETKWLAGGASMIGLDAQRGRERTEDTR